jgi:hypothetical protein
MKEVKELFLDFIATYGYAESDLNKEGGYSGNLGEYMFLKNIFKVYKYLSTGDEQHAILQFKDTLEDIDFSFDPTNATDEDFDKAMTRREIVKKVKELKAEVEADVYEPLLKIAEKHDFFKDEEIDRETVPSDILLNVKDWMNKNFLKKYNLKNGTTEIPTDISQFVVSNDMYLSNNLNYFIENFNKQYDDDIARVTVFFKIDENCIEHSYFMFIVNYKDHAIAYSDLTLSANPHMCRASRNPRKRMQDKHCYCWLPYTLIDELDDIRKDTSTLATIDNKVEFHKLPWKRFTQGQRMYTLLVIKDLIENLSKGEAKQLVSAQKYVSQKLIEGESIDVDEWTDNEVFTNWGESNKEHAEEIIDNMLGKSESKELMVTSYDVVKKSDLYDESLLATAEVHESHAKWIAVNNYKENIQNEIGRRLHMLGNHDEKSKKNYEGGRDQLRSMLQGKLISILEKLSVAEELYFVPDDSKYGSFSNEKDKKVLLNFQYRISEEFLMPFITIGSTYGWYPEDPDTVKCPILPQYKGSTMVYFKIRHYSQLMYLLDCTREELPKYFRCYKTHYMVPYSGNSILSNTHPLNALYDPCSRQHPNGIIIRAQISKRGYNKIVKEAGGKKRPVKMTIDVNGNAIDGIDYKNEVFSTLIG